MDATENIKLRIMNSARENAASILAAAQSECDAQKNEALADIAAQEAAALSRAAHKAAEIKSRREMLSKLDGKKATLKAKQDMVDKVYKTVLNNLLALKNGSGSIDAGYTAFIERIIVASAEPGDEVIVAEADKKRLTAEWLAGVCKKHNLRLSLSNETHNGDGGVILRNPRFDKRLTLSALLTEAREKTENEVIKILFE